MMGGLDLEATTHLVGHSLRECDGAIRAVMSSMLTEEQRAAVDGAGDLKHKEQIEQICTLLGFAPEDEVRAEWWAWGRRLHEWTHRYSLRAPRPVDEPFRRWWAQGQAVLHVVVHRFETVYGEALPRVAELAERETPTANNLTELREQIPHGDVALDRFFTLATPGWFDLLRDGDYFSGPPALEPDEEGRVGYVPWPPGAYLVRLAAGDHHRREIVALGAELRDTNNPAAHEAVVEIALAVRAEDSASLAETVVALLDKPFQWRLPFRAQELVVHYASAGLVDPALLVFRALLGSAQGYGASWRVRVSLDELVPKVFPQLGVRGVELLVELLGDELAARAGGGGSDYSYMWRPAVESGRSHDLRDALVTGLREALGRVVDDDGTLLPELVALLEQQQPSIFSRLALDLVRRFPDGDLVAERLGDRVRFEDYNLEREWTLLAQGQFATVQSAVRDAILGWIDAGPDDGGAAETERRERWQRLQLVRLGDGLPEEWRRRRDELIARYGEPDARRSGRAIWSGSEPPISQAELAAKSIDEIRAFLDEWRPGADAFSGPSVEGLARALQAVVADDPARFADAAAAFTTVEPTYARHLVSGLVTAAWAGAQLNWEPILSFAEAALAQPRHVEGRTDEDTTYIDRGWSMTRLELARLLSASLERSLIPEASADRVWALLETLIEDPEPDEAYERQWSSSMGPSGLSLNTIRGAAMHALMHYMWWRKRQAPEGEATLEARLRAALERHLDPHVEVAHTVRAVYGQWFPFIVAADHAWAEQHVEAIFSEDAVGRAAWDSYLLPAHVYSDVAVLLRSQYANAVGRTATEASSDDEVAQQLVGHLIALYVQQIVDLGDDVLGRFFDEAPIEVRAKLIDAIGIDVTNADDLSAETLARLRALWESRLASARASDQGALRELRGFSWWFSSGKFDDSWSLAQLTDLLDAGGTVEFDYVVVERLGALGADRLAEVVRALEALIDATDDPWFALGSRDEIREILAAGLASDDSDVAARARAATNRLVARGNAEFGDLLE